LVLTLSLEYSDVTIKVGDKKFYAQKCILCVWSSFFAGMFSKNNAMKESQKDEIELKDIDPEIFELLLIFIYTGIDATKLITV
jgi:hypothetical protein